MKCPHCSSQWNLAAGIAPPRACPFCGKPLQKEEDAWREVHTPQECFAWALELMGREGLRESGRVQGLFAETGEALRREMGLVHAFLQCGGNAAFLDALDGDAPAQALTRARVEEALVTEKWIARPAARYICDSFWFAITGSGTAVLAAGEDRPREAAPPPAPAKRLRELSFEEKMALPAETLIRICEEGGEDSHEALELLIDFAYEEASPQAAPAAFYMATRCLQHFTRDPAGSRKMAPLAREYLEKAAQKGHPQAAALLAEFLDRGDPQKALFWYETAARAGDPHAMGEYGWLLTVQARKRLKEIEESPMAYFQRSGREEAHRLYREGIDWMEKGAAAGSAEAMYQRGWQHQLGFKPLQPSSDATALTWYQKAVEKGHGGAMRRIGDLYHYGNGGLAKDPNAALEWYTKAAEAGHAPAFSSTGDLLDSAAFYELPDHKALALEWYKKGAEAGDPTSMLRLGDSCRFGWRGLVEDPAAAKKWYLKAADAGSFSAPGKLAALYLAGEGVEQSKEKAIFWYRKALENGDLSAADQLKELGVDP